MGKNCWTEVVSRLERYISFFWEVQEPKKRRMINAKEDMWLIFMLKVLAKIYKIWQQASGNRYRASGNNF